LDQGASSCRLNNPKESFRPGLPTIDLKVLSVDQIWSSESDHEEISLENHPSTTAFSNGSPTSMIIMILVRPGR
jgi:hypothetical protein